MRYRASHITGAAWSIRPRLDRLDLDSTRPVILRAEEAAGAAWAAEDLRAQGVTDIQVNTGTPASWSAAGIPLESTPAVPADSECIDYLFFVHDRHDGNKAAARQYRQHFGRGRQAKRGARLLAVALQRNVVGHRVADKTRIDAVPGVDRRFHREQAQHQVGAVADLFGALLAPGPDRGADVVHGAHATLLEPALDAKVEVGGVDADEHIRLPFQCTLAERRAQLQQSWQVAQYFGQPHHRQFAGESVLSVHAPAPHPADRRTLHRPPVRSATGAR
ncbi:hypothetical protein G6F57_017837 [Rhizopus arrhizus]|nr:hypothetical protein G6F57_017837 [Rhizopus arrhizus]